MSFSEVFFGPISGPVSGFRAVPVPPKSQIRNLGYTVIFDPWDLKDVPPPVIDVEAQVLSAPASRPRALALVDADALPAWGASGEGAGDGVPGEAEPLREDARGLDDLGRGGGEIRRGVAVGLGNLGCGGGEGARGRNLFLQLFGVGLPLEGVAQHLAVESLLGFEALLKQLLLLFKELHANFEGGDLSLRRQVVCQGAGEAGEEEEAEGQNGKERRFHVHELEEGLAKRGTPKVAAGGRGCNENEL